METDTKKMDITLLEDLITEDFGPIGTAERDQFEMECDAFIIGERIKDERLRAGMTQEQLASMVGTKKSYISRIEKGRTDIQLSTLVKLFQGLGLHVSVRVSSLSRSWWLSRSFLLLFDSAEIANFTPDEKKKYDLDMRTERDFKNQLAYAKEEGLKEGMERGLEKGLEKGIEQGREEGRISERDAIAQRLLAKGMTQEEVEALVKD